MNDNPTAPDPVSKGRRQFDEHVNYLDPKLLRGMLMMGIKKAHPNKYSPKESNCKFCRKKCPLFLKNECFKKSVEEQRACEHLQKK